MSTQSEAALEAGLIATLLQMDYEYVQIVEEDNMYANFKRQLEVHNRKRLEEHGRSEFTTEEFEKILIYLEGGTRFEKAKKLRDLYPLDTADGPCVFALYSSRSDWALY
jgi:type I restriction enzyme R subunit